MIKSILILLCVAISAMFLIYFAMFLIDVYIDISDEIKHRINRRRMKSEAKKIEELRKKIILNQCL